MEYDFVLKFKLPEDSVDPDDLVERLGRAGCDDALVGTGQPGRIALDFTRRAESAQQAVISALEDVTRAIPNVELIERLPDAADWKDLAYEASVLQDIEEGLKDSDADQVVDNAEVRRRFELPE